MSKQNIVFKVLDYQFCIDAIYCQDFISAFEISGVTPLPKQEKYMHGLFSYNSKIHVLLNFEQMLTPIPLEPLYHNWSSTSHNKHILLLRLDQTQQFQGSHVGLLVNGLATQRNLSAKNWQNLSISDCQMRNMPSLQVATIKNLIDSQAVNEIYVSSNNQECIHRITSTSAFLSALKIQ